MSYFVLSVSEDGVSISRYADDEVQEFLDDIIDEEAGFLTEEKMLTDPWYWGETNYAIIKGEAVVPKKKKVVERYEVE